MADQHIKSLRRVTNLRSLHLADTDVTDSSVQFLSNLRLLTQLDVQGTQITTTGVKRLRAGLPRCEIAY
jgi:hypothetical protein